MLTVAGANRVLALDLHTEQIQGFFSIPVDHLYGGPLLAEHLNSRGVYGQEVVVVSPDEGGVGRAQSLALQLDSRLAIIHKRRPEPNRSEVVSVVGDVTGKTCVLIDDMIDTGGSLCGAAKALRERGADRILAACTHSVLSGQAIERLVASEDVERVIRTDTIHHPHSPLPDKFETLSVAPLLAEAIHRIHRGASVSELFLPYL
jgi:ribose-phosphate pyrophosphokinase